MSQSWTTIRNQLKTIVEGVSGIQIVHGFPRIDSTNNAARWLKMFQTTKRVDAWTILRTGALTTMITNCEVEVRHQVVIRGLYSHDDFNESQDAFDDRVDAIMLALYPNLTLGANATHQGPAVLSLEELRYASDTLVHYAEITTQVFQNVMVTGKT